MRSVNGKKKRYLPQLGGENTTQFKIPLEWRGVLKPMYSGHCMK